LRFPQSRRKADNGSAAEASPSLAAAIDLFGSLFFGRMVNKWQQQV
jgi:hypothetical protein